MIMNHSDNYMECYIITGRGTFILQHLTVGYSMAKTTAGTVGFTGVVITILIIPSHLKQMLILFSFDN